MDASAILDKFLGEIAQVHATGAGTKETSYYGALQRALSEVGSNFKPKVFCLQQMSGKAIFPDFGLFSNPQLGQKGVPTVWPEGPVPERGVVEADDIDAATSIRAPRIMASRAGL